jgi:hypothetical protein
MNFCRLTAALIVVVSLLLQSFPAASAPPDAGVIEGSLSYPSEFIPPDMTICAENLATKQIYCTNKHLKAKQYKYKVGYKLTAPPGDYHVFAQLPNPAKYGAGYPKDYRAYYSKFVQCGMIADCLDHFPIVVKVKRGETVSGIDPMDWYQ